MSGKRALFRRVQYVERSFTWETIQESGCYNTILVAKKDLQLVISKMAH